MSAPIRIACAVLCLASLAPITALAQHSKNVTDAAENFAHRKGVRATRAVRHQHATFKRYTHRKRSHIKHYLDTH